VEDRARVVTSAVLGALVGGIMGYLFLTEDGRRLRERLEPGAEDVLGELRRLGEAAESAKAAASEGLQSLQAFRRGRWPEAGEARRDPVHGYAGMGDV